MFSPVLYLHLLVVVLYSAAAQKECSHFNYTCSTCDPGFYGNRCERRCITSCKDLKCFQWTGKCAVGCEDGWHGYHCESKCYKCHKNICSRTDGSCIYPDPCDGECKPGCSTYCDGKEGESDTMRNVIFILTGIGSAVCLGLVVCCLCILFKRRRERHSDIRMEILPRSQKLIERPSDSSYPNTISNTSGSRNYSHDQPLLGYASSSHRGTAPSPGNREQYVSTTARCRQDPENTNILDDAVADIGMFIPPAPPTNQGRVRIQGSGQEPPPSYQTLFSPT